MSEPHLQKLKNNDPNHDGTRMAHEVAGQLGIPSGTSMWAFPKKPLGKPDSTKSQGVKGQGHSKPGNAKPGRSVSRSPRSSRGHAKKSKGDFSGSWD